MGRYLTQDDKAVELRSWEAAKRQRTINPPAGFVGGHGYPDPEIYAFVDRLNRLHRLCTLQSCSGHRCTDASMCGYCIEQEARLGLYQGDHVWAGQLWLWADEKLASWFLAHATELAAQPSIEKLSILWHVEGREIIDIVFKGAGTGGLDASTAAVCQFFERGNMECNLG